MAILNKTYQPIQSLTIKAESDLPAFRFVSFGGQVCGDNQKSLGVTVGNWTNGAYASVIVLGTAIVESAENINIGDKVASNAIGKAKVATTGSEINGRALNSATAGEFVRILLVP